MSEHQGAIFSGVLDTHECRSNTLTDLFKTLNTKTPNFMCFGILVFNVLNQYVGVLDRYSFVSKAPLKMAP
jgi:hypothetical protein